MTPRVGGVRVFFEPILYGSLPQVLFQTVLFFGGPVDLNFSNFVSGQFQKRYWEIKTWVKVSFVPD